MKLLELFDQPVKYEIDSDGDGWTAAFTVNGEHFEVLVEQISTDAYEVSFRSMEGLKLTGRGDAVTVFSTVINIVRDLVKSNPKQIRTISFRGDKSEASRAPLYARLAKKAAAELGWTTRRKEDSEFDEFIIDAPNSNYKVRQVLLKRATS
jgi:hypothetical protein